MEITLQLTKKDDWDVVNYVGPINEEAEVHLAGLSGKVGSRCVINFEKVEYVNSCGVRAWINFMREFEKDRKVIFENCTPEIVMQINMIPSFKSSATIQSVLGPYSCPSCSNTHMRLYEAGKNLPDNLDNDFPQVKCDKCGEDMELDELEDEFFAFIMDN